MKSWLRSKTIWFNLLIIVVGIAGHYLFLNFEARSILISNGVIGLFLRWTTTDSIKKEKTKCE